MSLRSGDELVAGVELVVHEPGSPGGPTVVLVHGGTGRRPVESRWRSPSYLRVRAMVPAVARVARPHRAGVVTLVSQAGGWTQPLRGPQRLAAAAEALAASRGSPLVLVGHSSGGWASLAVASHPEVAGVCAVSPWVGGLSAARLVGTPVRVVHGDQDSICPIDPVRTLVGELTARGADATLTELPGEGHALLRNALRAHRAVAEAVADLLP